MPLFFASPFIQPSLQENPTYPFSSKNSISLILTPTLINFFSFQDRVSSSCKSAPITDIEFGGSNLISNIVRSIRNIMEDCNMLISDCIVISCCCQCLILQLIIFVFIKLPRKLARKTRDYYAKKKLAHYRRRRKGEIRKVSHDYRRGEFVGIENGSSSMSLLELEGIAASKFHNWGDCSNEVDKMLEELSMKGEFAFGSFWGRDNQEIGGFCCKCSRIMTKEEVLEFGNHVVKFHFIEIVGPATFSDPHNAN